MPDYDLFLSILPEADRAFVDDSYSRSELEAKEYDELRTLATQVESDDINGRSPKEDIIDYLEGHTRL